MKKIIILISLLVLTSIAYADGGKSTICGDVNADDMLNVLDYVALTQYIFGLADTPAGIDNADTFCNGRINIADVYPILFWIFNGGPFPNCDCK